MANAPEPGGLLSVSADGTVSVPAFELPLSAVLSAQNRAMLALMLGGDRARIEMPDPAKPQTADEYRRSVDAFRSQLDGSMAKPFAERLLQMFPVKVTPSRIAGVSVEEFLPLEGAHADRVLINLHGGGFMSGQTHVARMESIPVAHKGKFRVVSVDYRQGYEHRFPAASEDVAAVYRELLKSYAPSHIGIYGTSAGGMLALQATAWLIEHALPVPAAIGVFSAGTGGSGGDGDWFGAIGTGIFPPYGPIGCITAARHGYFAGAPADSHLVDPNLAPPAFRAKFPPALFITGTRAFDLSPALASHRALVQAGVDASLHVFDGLAHAFFYDAVAPESIDAYDTIVRFFSRHLAV